MEPVGEYSFSAVKGMQAGREYYVTMCPLKLIPRLFLFDERELPPELRAQRSINKRRVPEIASYVTDNPDAYVFSALTASIDGTIRFEPLAAGPPEGALGVLHVPMDARFIINDGQHRRAAIELAISEKPELGSETIAVVFFADPDLGRCQQMFTDLNRSAIRSSRSLSVLYDHRDPLARLVRLVVIQSPVFDGLVELENNTLSTRSSKLFTLSALYSATKHLLAGFEELSEDDKRERAQRFWTVVAEQMAEWKRVSDGEMTAGELRKHYVHSHSVVLQAIAIVGNHLLRHEGNSWADKLAMLGDVDWSRANADMWEGRAIVGGRVANSRNNVALTVNAIKNRIGIELGEEERKVEQAFARGNHGRE